MASGYLPLAALLLATAVAILAATSAVPAAAGAGADKYGGRMIIIRAPGASSRVLDVSAGGGALNKWQQQRRRRRLVEDEVAPEFGGLLGAANGGHVSNNAGDKDRAVCLPDGSCAARGGSYTRPCTYKDHCPH